MLNTFCKTLNAGMPCKHSIIVILMLPSYALGSNCTSSLEDVDSWHLFQEEF